jgi:hypothetical protein
MKNLKGILSPELYSSVYNRFTNLSRFARVKFDFFTKEDNVIIINVTQFEKLTDHIYSEKELIEFTREFVDILEKEGYKVHINPKPYESDEMGNISAAWVKEQMKKKGVSQRFLAKEFGVDEFVMSKILNNKIGFTRWHKAAFFYYFK